MAAAVGTLEGRAVTPSSGGSARHGGTQDIPVEALLSDDFELWLARAPLVEPGTSCQYEACDSDEVCTCQDPEDERDI